jgi:hypothetical protein
MPLPDFHDSGDLAEGIHRATIDEVRQRLGTPRINANAFSSNFIESIASSKQRANLKDSSSSGVCNNQSQP